VGLVENQELTTEQRKQVAKILFKARANLFFIGFKFSIGLFGANMACILLGLYLFSDSNPQDLTGFNFTCMLANLAFMVLYLYEQLKTNADNVATKIKEVLKSKSK